MIEMQGVTKIFRGDTVETYAVRSVSLEVGKGEFLAIMGPSGSGKTTFLNILGLLEEPSSGLYRLEGEDVSRLNDNRRARIRNEKIGFVFQGFNLIPDLDVYENVQAPLDYRRISAAQSKQRVTAALERVGLLSRRNHFPAQLSGGQQQRVAIARAVAGEPALILADEPTGNLDTLMTAQIMQLLEEINAGGTTIIMVTHNPALAERAHRCIEIVDGRVTVAQPVDPASSGHNSGALEAS
jgi:putative ABC transport system ATP-binding protein